MFDKHAQFMGYPAINREVFSHTNNAFGLNDSPYSTEDTEAQFGQRLIRSNSRL